nr:MAG TPA: hypothetical protein [Caudoviricetes sp.]
MLGILNLYCFGVKRRSSGSPNTLQDCVGKLLGVIDAAKLAHAEEDHGNDDCHSQDTAGTLIHDCNSLIRFRFWAATVAAMVETIRRSLLGVKTVRQAEGQISSQRVLLEHEAAVALLQALTGRTLRAGRAVDQRPVAVGLAGAHRFGIGGLPVGVGAEGFDRFGVAAIGVLLDPGVHTFAHLSGQLGFQGFANHLVLNDGASHAHVQVLQVTIQDRFFFGFRCREGQRLSVGHGVIETVRCSRVDLRRFGLRQGLRLHFRGLLNHGGQRGRCQLRGSVLLHFRRDLRGGLDRCLRFAGGAAGSQDGGKGDGEDGAFHDLGSLRLLAVVQPMDRTIRLPMSWVNYRSSLRRTVDALDDLLDVGRAQFGQLAGAVLGRERAVRNEAEGTAVRDRAIFLLDRVNHKAPHQVQQVRQLVAELLAGHQRCVGLAASVVGHSGLLGDPDDGARQLAELTDQPCDCRLHLGVDLPRVRGLLHQVGQHDFGDLGQRIEDDRPVLGGVLGGVLDRLAGRLDVRDLDVGDVRPLQGHQTAFSTDDQRAVTRQGQPGLAGAGFAVDQGVDLAGVVQGVGVLDHGNAS